MRKHIFLALAVLLGTFGLYTANAIAADEAPSASLPILQEEYEGVAQEKIMFNQNVLPGDTQYVWDFGDGTTSQSAEPTHEYQNRGEYQVILTKTTNNQELVERARVKVYEDVVVCITDGSVLNEELESAKTIASREGAYFALFSPDHTDSDAVIENSLLDTILAKKDIVSRAHIVLLWTSGNTGFSLLSKLSQSSGFSSLGFTSKGIIAFVQDPSSNAVARLAQVAFSSSQPKYILLTKKSALSFVLTAKTADATLSLLRESSAEQRLIGVYSARATRDLGVTNFLSYTINYLINHGVASENIFLLLMLPIIATIIAFTRQFIGIKTFGIYTPTLLTLAFFGTGLKYGLIIFVVVLITATLFRLLLSRFRLLYLPRMALVLTSVALVMLGVLVVSAETNRAGIISLSVFPMLVLIVLVEKFIAAQTEKGTWTAVILSLETVVVSVVCYYIVNWEKLKVLVLGYPELILLTFVINIVLAKWVGLRITEYIRFRRLQLLMRERR